MAGNDLYLELGEAYAAENFRRVRLILEELEAAGRLTPEDRIRFVLPGSDDMIVVEAISSTSFTANVWKEYRPSNAQYLLGWRAFNNRGEDYTFGADVEYPNDSDFRLKFNQDLSGVRVIYHFKENE